MEGHISYREDSPSFRIFVIFVRMNNRSPGGLRVGMLPGMLVPSFPRMGRLKETQSYPSSEHHPEVSLASRRVKMEKPTATLPRGFFLEI